MITAYCHNNPSPLSLINFGTLPKLAEAPKRRSSPFLEAHFFPQETPLPASREWQMMMMN
jgi:hypothetical protein